MKRLINYSIFILLGLALLAASCDKRNKNSSTGAASSNNPHRNEVLATIGDTQITIGQLEEELNKQNPYVRMRFNSLERKKEFLKNMVRIEVLAKEAKRQNLEQDPEVQQRVKRAMIDRMMEKMHASLVKIEEISEQEIADYYEKNKASYFQPAKTRASMIVVKSKTEATKVIALAQKKPSDAGYFMQLVKEYSIDEASKARRGDLEFFTKDATNIPPALVELAFATKQMWAVAGPVPLKNGFAVIMKTGEMEEVKRTLEQEKDRIRNRLFNEKRVKAMEQYVETLQAKANIQINEQNLEKVKISTSLEATAK